MATIEDRLLEQLRDQAKRLAEQYDGLYQCTLMPARGTSFPAEAHVPESLLDIAKAAFPPVVDPQIIEADFQASTMDVSVYLAAHDANATVLQNALASFRALAATARDSFKLKGPGRFFFAAMQVSPVLPDGTTTDGGGFTGNTESELLWLDHLYDVLKPITRSVPHNGGTCQVRALQCNIFEASVLGLAKVEPKEVRANTSDLFPLGKERLPRDLVEYVEFLYKHRMDDRSMRKKGLEYFKSKADPDRTAASFEARLRAARTDHKVNL
jgi:hypothetical protein